MQDTKLTSATETPAGWRLGRIIPVPGRYRRLRESARERREIRRLLGDIGVRLKGAFGGITYAKRCFLRKGAGVHLLFGHGKGAVSVLIMAGESAPERSCYGGPDGNWILLPCPIGSIAIIGEREQALEDVEQFLRDRIEFAPAH